MTEWIAWLSQYALDGGVGGLFALSVIDSVGVPTGGGPDILIALLVSLHPDSSYAIGLTLTAVVGSAIGCCLLYWFGLRGGGAAARRFAPGAIVRARGSLERHGAWVIFLAVLAPPPIPTKLFVFCAGVATVPVFRFVAATLVGRALRYGAGALLAVRYGQQTLDMVREGSMTVLLFLIPPGLLLLAFLVLRRRRQP